MRSRRIQAHVMVNTFMLGDAEGGNDDGIRSYIDE